MIDVPIYYIPTSLRFSTALGGGLLLRSQLLNEQLEPISHFLLPETQNSVSSQSPAMG